MCVVDSVSDRENSAEYNQSGGSASFNGCWAGNGRRQSSGTISRWPNSHPTDPSWPSQSSSSPSSDIGAVAVVRIAHIELYGLASGHRVRNARRIWWYWAAGTVSMESARIISKYPRIGAFRGGATRTSHCRLSHGQFSVDIFLLLLLFRLHFVCSYLLIQCFCVSCDDPLDKQLQPHWCPAVDVKIWSHLLFRINEPNAHVWQQFIKSTLTRDPHFTSVKRWLDSFGQYLWLRWCFSFALHIYICMHRTYNQFEQKYKTNTQRLDELRIKFAIKFHAILLRQSNISSFWCAWSSNISTNIRVAKEWWKCASETDLWTIIVRLFFFNYL